MAEPFFDREDELRALERGWDAPGSLLALVWGRRRTGKTRLLGRFADGKRAVFYGATQQSSGAELQALSQAVRASLRPSGADLLAHGDFPSWEAALAYLGSKAERTRLAVVIDEFPYLVDAEPTLPSLVQRFWDHHGRLTKLHLILCGSARAVMEDLQSSGAPLFGRVDVRLQLRPFGYREAALFNPGLTPTEQAICFGVLGGMPTYLQRWGDHVGHATNLRALFADPTSPLIEEGEFVLSSELPEGSGYFRILLAIATGNRTYGTIKRFADIDIQRQLERLLALGLVERQVPVTEDPARTKQVVYRIADNFLAFWFRFIYRHRANIARGLGPEVVRDVVLPGLSDYMGEPWEEMCREHTRSLAARGNLPAAVSSVGRWWSRDGSTEIDVVGVQGRTVVFAGSAKWSRSVGRGELDRLRRAVERLPDRGPEVTLALFAREGVRDVDKDDAMTFTASELYR